MDGTRKPLSPCPHCAPRGPASYADVVVLTPARHVSVVDVKGVLDQDVDQQSNAYTISGTD